MAAAHLEQEPGVSCLVDLSVRGTSLADAVLDATDGMGVDCTVLLPPHHPTPLSNHADPASCFSAEIYTRGVPLSSA
jgi:hypothetical protein